MPELDIILQAVFQLHKLEITYQKINNEVSVRTIRPYGLHTFRRYIFISKEF